MTTVYQGTGYDPYLALSPNFTLYEFTRSRIAKSRGIDNRIAEDHIIANLRQLCLHVLEPVRTLAGRPVRVSSGYRSAALNRAVGGVPESSHIFGEAADIVVGDGLVDLATLIADDGTIPFDQLILEERRRTTNVHLGAWSRWLHLSYRAHGPNRGDILTISRDGDDWRREWGLHPSEV